MSLSGPGITYILLIIPILFALVVFFQGLYKMGRHESDGQAVAVFGAVFLVLIAGVWWIFIR